MNASQLCTKFTCLYLGLKIGFGQVIGGCDDEDGSGLLLRSVLVALSFVGSSSSSSLNSDITGTGLRRFPGPSRCFDCASFETSHSSAATCVLTLESADSSKSIFSIASAEGGACPEKMWTVQEEVLRSSHPHPTHPNHLGRQPR